MPEYEDCNCGQQHNHERIWLNLTPDGITLNMLGVMKDIYLCLKQGRIETATVLTDLVGQLLSAAFRGNYDWITENYNNAMALRFATELEKLDDVAAAVQAEEDTRE